MGAGFLASSLSSCAPVPVFKGIPQQNKITVPLSEFGESNLLVIRNSNWEYDILLVKKSSAVINALLLMCSHQQNILTLSKTGLLCPMHGSTFDLDGNATKEPAVQPLKKFRTEVRNEIVEIDLKS
jgi:nitrite reductase/ring-hydroxylating ferredoxin subunit